MTTVGQFRLTVFFGLWWRPLGFRPSVIPTVGRSDRRNPRSENGRRSDSRLSRPPPKKTYVISVDRRRFFHGRSFQGQPKKKRWVDRPFFFGGCPTEIWLDRDFGLPGRGRMPTLIKTTTKRVQCRINK
jgi:hypothetical protein